LLLLLFPLHEAALASMAHGGGGRAKVTPNLAMDEEGTRVLNITVLQRLDPAVEDILITAGHVTLYDFDTNLNQWVRWLFVFLLSLRFVARLLRLVICFMSIWPDLLSLQSRKDVEGSLFVVKRFVPGFGSFLCLNLLILVFGYCLPVR
jgi:hypothetical protein